MRSNDASLSTLSNERLIDRIVEVPSSFTCLTADVVVIFQYDLTVR
jgi:hypothetical protein